MKNDAKNLSEFTWKSISLRQLVSVKLDYFWLNTEYVLITKLIMISSITNLTNPKFAICPVSVSSYLNEIFGGTTIFHEMGNFVRCSLRKLKRISFHSNEHDLGRVSWSRTFIASKIRFLFRRNNLFSKNWRRSESTPLSVEGATPSVSSTEPLVYKLSSYT